MFVSRARWNLEACSGILCVQEDTEERLSMALIALILSSYTVTLPLPKIPAFYYFVWSFV